MKAIERELELTTRALLASEDWASTYADAPQQHAQLIKNTAKMNIELMVYFRDLSKKVNELVDWFAYARAVIEQRAAMKTSSIQAYDVNVIVNQDAADSADQAFIKVVFDTIAATTVLGTETMILEHGQLSPTQMPIALSTTSELIQNLTTEQLANLVGMKVDKETGLITKNANPAFSIDETTRTRIANSIKTSIQLGETQQEAAARLESVIANPVRADMIARTETVRAFANGRSLYAKQSGATGKYNVDSNAIDLCADNTAQGIIPIDQDFLSGDPNEPFHPNCRCQVIYTYNDDNF
jgi:hypothetical protein